MRALLSLPPFAAARARAAVAILPAVATLLAAACSGGGDDGPPTGTGGTPAVRVSVSPSALSVVAGQSGTTTVTVTRSGGFADEVSLGLTGAPAGVTGSFAATTLSPAATTSVLTLAAAPSTTPGSYSLTVRATGDGVAEHTFPLSLGVTVPPSSGTYALALASPGLAVPQGGSATVGVTIARSSFAGAVALSVSGAPGGVTATIAPASTTADAAVLTVSATAAAALASFALTVRGSAQGLPDQTVTLAVQVTAPPSGDGLAWEVCASGAPLWLAYQDGRAGPWTQLPVTPGTRVTIPIASVGGVAWVTGESGGLRLLSVHYGTADELEYASEQWCLARGDQQLSGSVAGLGPQQASYVVFGQSGTYAQASQPGFTLRDLPDGTFDLLASRQRMTPAGSSTLTVAEAFIFRRALDPANGATLPVLDFDGPEAFAPVTREVTIANLGADEAQVTLAYVTANRTNGILFGNAMAFADATQDFPGVPADRQQPGDLHELLVTSSTHEIGDPLQVANRTAILFFRDATDRAVTLGPLLAEPVVTVTATTPHVQLRVQLPRQGEYDDQVTAQFNQLDRVATITASAGYFGGAPATWELTIPDLTAAGFDPLWMIGRGQQTIWAVNGFGWPASAATLTAPADGPAVQQATRGGALLP